MADEDKSGKNLVGQIRKFVAAAKELVRTADDADSGESSLTNQDVETNLKKLYPSTGSKSRRTNAMLSASEKTFGYEPSDKKLKRSGDGSKSAAPRQPKVTECLKDVFCIPDPKNAKVPRRDSRHFYYENSLVGTAVRFTSIMKESEIRQTINSHFFRHNSVGIRDFEFVKAVNDNFVVVEVGNFDYKTMRHVSGQGPLYIRSTYKIPVRGFAGEDDETSSQSSPEEYTDCEVESYKKASNSCSLDVESGPSRNRKVTEFMCRTTNCPICNRAFALEDIEEHAASCSAFYFDVKEFDYEISDDELEVHVQPSTEDPVCDTVQESVPSSEEIIDITNALEEISNSQKSTGHESIRVRRRSAWPDYVAYFNKPWKPTGIKNYRVTFLEESSVDAGGPKREFCSECLKQMSQTLFDGGVPLKSVMLVKENLFLFAGRLMAATLIQGGPNPAFLESWCYRIISQKNLPSPTDVEPTDLFLERPEIQKMLTAKTSEQFQNCLMEDHVFPVLMEIGYRGVATSESISSRTDIIKLYFYKKEVEPCLAALSQLQLGLNVHGLLDAMQNHPLSFKPCFIRSEKVIDADTFLQMIHCNYSGEPESNTRAKEVNLMKFFTDFVEYACYSEDIDCITVPELLKFITGSASVPALGFGMNRITVQFKHNCEIKEIKEKKPDGSVSVCAVDCRCLPVASTCALELTLPTHCKSEVEMRTMLNDAVRESYGFGRI